MSDYVPWAALRHESQEFLQPWEPTWPVDDLTRPSFRRRLRRYGRDIKDDLSYPYFVFREKDDALLGSCIVSNVRRGVAQSCSLGYWMGKPYAGGGYMTAAVAAIVPYVFDELKIHRIEAACLPSNEPSQRLLNRVGFFQEGQARRYLKINGEWRDHVLFAIIADDVDA
jgi:ribosomal-protein-alanine N-acetyltransferase